MPESIPPLVSVIVPAYNAADHIGAALDSIARQEGPFELEIIVVDDGSSDATCALVDNFGGARLYTQANAGPSAARNRGIAEARGDFIAFLDADDLWTRGTLAAQLAVFDAYPDVGMVFGDCRIFTADGLRPQSLFEAGHFDLEYWGHPAIVQDAYAKLFQVNFIPTGAVVVRRQCLDRAGLFDESRRYVEDMDLWFRVALRCTVGYTTHICELKREHAHNVSADWERMTLAFIDVLESQARLFPGEIRRLAVNIPRRIAFEYSLMGDKRERCGNVKAARQRYLQALRTYPSVRPLYYWLRTWIPKIRG